MVEVTVRNEQQIAALTTDSHWQNLARVAMRDDLSALAGSLSRSVLRAAQPGQGAQALIAAWETRREFQLRRWRELLSDLKTAGTLDMACNQLMWDFLKRCDLLLAVGFDAVDLIKPWSLSVPAIHIDAVPNTDQIYAADTELVGDIAATLEALAAGWKGEPRWKPATVKRHREALRAAYYAGRVKGRLNPTDVIDAVHAALPREAVATADVGSHKLLVGQGWSAYSPRTVLMSNGLSSMGYSLPAAIVAQMLAPRRPVVCFVGDGGLAMVQGELRLAASLKLPLLVVVFCDNSLNRIEIKQANRRYPSWGTRLDPTRIDGLARAMACEGVMVDSPAALERALSGRRPKDRPLVIGAQIDPAQYTRQF